MSIDGTIGRVADMDILSRYIAENIRMPSTFEQLRTTAAGDCLRHLVDHLVLSCDHPAIVNALLYVCPLYLSTRGYLLI